MEKFLSCDWGSSTFRLRLVNTADLSVIDEEKSQQGITNCFGLWKQSMQKEEERLFFYLRIIKDHIHEIESRLKISLKGIPLIVSGMASSNIGMEELPYRELPFPLDGTELGIRKFEPSGFFNHDLWLVSGVRISYEVMRGEETLLIGAWENTGLTEEVYLFPGTHSKHVHLKGGTIQEFRTYMTGDFFDCLSTKTVLSSELEKSRWEEFKGNEKGFRKGVRAAESSNLLHSTFRVRTNGLFGKLSKQENYYYLSGLLIGTEIAGLIKSPGLGITLVCDPELQRLYQTAFEVLGGNQPKFKLTLKDAREALVAGQWRILRQQVSTELPPT